ncbi:MAG: CAP domain-containing protein [Gilvibacter sp.]
MNLLRTSLLAVVLCFAMASCSKDDPTEALETNYTIDLSLANKTDWQMATEILQLVNDHRASLQLAPIQMDRRLATAHAVSHSEHMIAMDELSHDGYAQRSQALIQNGAISVGENVALGYITAEAVVNAWLHSPAHKQVIEGDYSHSGFGIVQDFRGTYYFTHLFYLE